MRMNWFSHDYSFPSAKEPEWHNLVERWYQLDAPAFGVTEVYWRHRDLLRAPPAWMLLCSPGASNLTDSQFAQTAQPSPAKFVHTLPNIRSASLLQVMKWSGQVLCLQNDPATILTGLREGLALCEDGALPVWVVSVTAEEQGYRAHIFVLSAEGGLKIENTPPQIMAKAPVHDKQWISWLTTEPRTAAFQGSDLWIE